MTRAEHELVGADVAGYRIEQLLGRDGATVAYVAIDPQGTRVELRLTDGADSEYRECALLAMRRAASLDHPNVRGVLDAGEENGALWVAIQRVDGVDLVSLLEREGPLDPARAVSIVAQLADAIDTGRFARGLVHGHLTPRAVVLVQPGDRALVDFATPPPRAATPLDDVGALGGILRDSIAGRVPPTPLLDVARQATAPGTGFSTCRDLAAAAADALAWGLNPPSSTVHDVAADVEPVPPSVVEEGMPTPAPPARGHRVALVAAAAAAAALVAAGAVGAILVAGEDGAATPGGRAEPPEGATPAVEGLNLSAGPHPVPLPGSILRIDPARGAVRARIAVPAPRMLAADGRSLWVVGDTGASGALLAHVDMPTAMVTGFVNAQTTPSSIAAAGGRLWIGDAFGNVHVLRGGGRIGESERFDQSTSLVGDSLAAAHGSVWLSWFPAGPCCTFPPDLYRLDPRNGRVIARIRGLSQVVVAGDGFVWAVEDNRRDVFEQLVFVDTRTHKTRRIGDLGFDWNDLVGVGDFVWASRPLEGAISHMNRQSQPQELPISLGRREGQPPPQPTAIAAGAGSIWVAVPDNRAVVRYDLARRRLAWIPVPGRPIDLVFASGSLWVALDERRGRLAAAPPERPPPDAASGTETQP